MPRPYDIYDEPDSVLWTCEHCQRRYRGGVRVELAFTCCVPCLRDLAAADPDELIAQWMREANEADETAKLIGSIGTGEPWWRLLSRRWYRRKAREQRTLVDEWRERMAAVDYRAKIAAEIAEFKDVLAVVEERHGTAGRGCI